MKRKKMKEMEVNANAFCAQGTVWGCKPPLRLFSNFEDFYTMRLRPGQTGPELAGPVLPISNPILAGL